MSTKLLEVLHLDAADTVVLVTGDTDLAPAVRTAQSLFPTKRIWFVFPYKRKNSELARLADGSCYIRKERYVQHQFPAVVTLATGRTITRPTTW
jgi:Trk K+ transport system NAD-binding subunit